MIHELKTLPEYFEAAIKGKKLFEARKYDRPFKKGDILGLNEYDAITKKYTGRCCLVFVDYILTDPAYVKDGFVIMSIKPFDIQKTTIPNLFKLPPDYTVTVF